jgi:hypothetical protein
VAEGEKLSALGSRDETAEPSPGDVLEEHALHGILRAEAQDLVMFRLGDLHGQASETLETVPYVEPMRKPRDG